MKVDKKNAKKLASVRNPLKQSTTVLSTTLMIEKIREATIEYDLAQLLQVPYPKIESFLRKEYIDFNELKIQMMTGKSDEELRHEQIEQKRNYYNDLSLQKLAPQFFSKPNHPTTLSSTKLLKVIKDSPTLKDAYSSLGLMYHIKTLEKLLSRLETSFYELKLWLMLDSLPDDENTAELINMYSNTRLFAFLSHRNTFNHRNPINDLKEYLTLMRAVKYPKQRPSELCINEPTDHGPISISANIFDKKSLCNKNACAAVDEEMADLPDSDLMLEALCNSADANTWDAIDLMNDDIESPCGIDELSLLEFDCQP